MLKLIALTSFFSAASLDQLARLVRVHCQRLLANHVLARHERSLGVRMMQIVRRGEMHNINVRIGEHFVERVVCTRNAKLGGFLLGLLWGFFGQPHDLDSVPPQSFDVRRADKSSSGHTHADCLLCQLLLDHNEASSELRVF